MAIIALRLPNDIYGDVMEYFVSEAGPKIPRVAGLVLILHCPNFLFRFIIDKFSVSIREAAHGTHRGIK